MGFIVTFLYTSMRYFDLNQLNFPPFAPSTPANPFPLPNCTYFYFHLSFFKNVFCYPISYGLHWGFHTRRSTLPMATQLKKISFPLPLSVICT